MGTRRLLLLVASGLTALSLITGCGDDDDDAGGATTPTSAPSTSATPSTPPASPSPATTEPTTEEAAVQEIAVTIEGGDITPSPDRIEVDAGMPVRIVVTSDVHDEIHVHGYDLSAEVEPGGTATIEFEADQTGLFEVESHELHAPLFQLQVQ